MATEKEVIQAKEEAKQIFGSDIDSPQIINALILEQQKKSLFDIY
jgi:hypothetical protein